MGLEDVYQGQKLFPREHQVLSYVVKGHRSTRIGAELNISPKTVKNYYNMIQKKLGVRSLSEAVKKWEGMK